MSETSRYLDYLPALFREHPFLGKFLLPFERRLDELNGIIDDIARYVDPATTDSDFLPWLSSFVALTLDPEWQENKRRTLIARAVDLYRRRGTVGGLRQYLNIYTGMEPEIREWRQPGGMQIGVASQIGGLVYEGAPADAAVPDIGPIVSLARCEPLYRDYYVVRMLACDPADRISPPGLIDPGRQPATLYLSADPSVVRSVAVTLAGGLPQVDIILTTGAVMSFSPAVISRRDHLIDEIHLLSGRPDPDGPDISAQYRGDTVLIDETGDDDTMPYHFIVDVRIPPGERNQVTLDKVRAIVDLEKPAHTVYYLKLTDVEDREFLRPMQIEVTSDIGINTVPG
ncbi:hypothetical protein JCM14469_16120 [Desulfatiferula olefinivorans]